jgi:hypothetical protein
MKECSDFQSANAAVCFVGTFEQENSKFNKPAAKKALTITNPTEPGEM